MGNLVSVIMPTYKRPFKVLMRAVNSVLSQSHTNFELIIVDDSPKHDLNRNEVENGINTVLDNRVKYIQHDYNQGACKARNTGIQNSKGDYVAFLDDDDEWLPNKLELQLRKFDNLQVGLVYCDSYTIISNEGVGIKSKIRSNRISGWVYDKLILENFVGSASFVMVKREVLDSCGTFNNYLRSAQDYELWLRISKKYKVDFVDVPLVNYYIHDGERISANVDNKIQGLEKLIELNMEYLQSHNKSLSLRKLKIVPHYAIKNGCKIGLMKWFEAITIYPFQIENLRYLICVFKEVLRKCWN